MQSFTETSTQSLLQLPDATLIAILGNLDAVTLVALDQSCKFFTRKDSVSRLALTEHIAREQVISRCQGDEAAAQRFRNISWKERLYLEADAGCGFDRPWCEPAGFAMQASPDIGIASAHSPSTNPIMRLTGMGPKLLLSDKSTADQPVLRWQLRVRGNTAVEFGVVPVNLPLTHTALHKCQAVPGAPDERCVGFCSQITAGSLLPLKAPVMRGTVLDIVARRGRLEVVLNYPPDAKEISWHGGQPVQRPYRGPSQLRFEQDFSSDFDLRLAVTSWAKATFEVMHTGHNAVKWIESDIEDEEAEIAAAAAAAIDAAVAGAAQANLLAAHPAFLAAPGALPPAQVVIVPGQPDFSSPMEESPPSSPTLKISPSTDSLRSDSGEPAVSGLPELTEGMIQGGTSSPVPTPQRGLYSTTSSSIAIPPSALTAALLEEHSSLRGSSSSGALSCLDGHLQ